MTWVAEYALPEQALSRPYEAGTPGLQYLSRRSQTGWSSENVIPPQSVQYGLACPSYVAIVGWSAGLESGVLADGIAQESGLSPGGNFAGESLECGHDEPRLATDLAAGFEERAGFQNLFLRHHEPLSYRLVNLTPEGAPHPRPADDGQHYFPASFLAGSDDLAHVVFEEELPLTREAEQVSPEVEAACDAGERGCWEGHDHLYEWIEGSDGQGMVRLVTILPDGNPVEGTLAGATRNNGGGGAGSPELFTPNVAASRHAVSADGSHIFFEAGGNLYVRQGGAVTVQIDLPEAGLPEVSGGGGEFMAASADGSRVLFAADASHLLTADTAPGSGRNLYLCELAADGEPCTLSNLTPAPEADVLGVSGTGEALSHTYFVAEGVLTADTSPTGAAPVPGQPNLYLRHDDVTSFIATLDGTERGTNDAGLPCTRTLTQGSCLVTFGDSCDWTARGGCRFRYENGKLTSASGALTARVSENGRYLALNSIKPLTGYDNDDPSSELPGEKPHAQIFVYDAAADELSCASCNPDPSVPPTAPAIIRQAAFPAGNTYHHGVYPQRNLTESGQVFFESYDALLPGDTGGSLSVYAWKDGGLSLLSSGDSEHESVFLDATPSGSDVFFLAAEQLLPADRDSAYDIYDARVGGGFPAAAAPAPPCEAEAQCRSPATRPPTFRVPMTSVFHGPGNQRQASTGKKRKRKHRKRRGHRRRGVAARTAAVSSIGGPAQPTTTSAQSEEVVEAGTAPHVVTEDAQNIETTSAELRGKVYHELVFNSPQCVLLGLICHNSVGSKITVCKFEYATAEHHAATGGYDGAVGCQPPPPYPETEQVAIVKAALTDLEPHTEYAYRLMAQNERGETGHGETRSLMTLGTFGPPTIEKERYRIERQEDGSFAAVLSADVNPHGHETTCRAEYVPEAKFRETAFAEATALPCVPETLPVGFGGERVSVEVSDLPAAARYRFRFLAENAAGEGVGAEKSFITFAIEAFFAGQSRLEAPNELLEPEPEDLQAGGHPYQLNTRFRLSTAPESPWGNVYPSFAIVNAKDIVTKLPPGLIGNPLATPRCAAHEVVHATCSGAAQVGVLRIEANRRQPPMGQPHYRVPLYNLVPPQGVAAQLGAPLPKPVQAAAHVDAGVGAGLGYGVEAAALNSSTAEGLISVTATIWGVPHDTRHNPERFCPKPDDVAAVASGGGQCPSDEELERGARPFLRNPTSCSTSQEATTRIDAWQAPGDFAAASAPMPQMQNCEDVPFEPEISLLPTTSAADSPAGLDVRLRLPQSEALTGPSQADLRKAVVTLPAGLTINNASADGLAGCSPAQIELRGEEPARCPDAAKIGTVEVETPLLDHPLRGAVYVATPHRNPFGSLLAIYIALEDRQSGVVVKLLGQVEIDRATGRLTATFDENPQLPFADFRLDFFDGPRAPLRTPSTCGTFATAVELTPWSSPEGQARRSSSFRLGSGPNGSPCPTGGLHPANLAFSAGALSVHAGAFSPFAMRLSRAPGAEEIRGLSLTLPSGLTGRLAGVPYCPEQRIQLAAVRAGRHEAADPSCGAASRIGTVTVATGAGSNPLHVRGDAYLAGPYRGAPLSLAVVTPAVAGPFDLGTVVVRTALYVDPRTARIRAVAGPIPTALAGIPLDVRSIAVEIDRPSFALNPTSCEPMTIAATALSTLGRAAPLSERFQVGGCKGLPFRPKLALRLKGRTRRAAHPALSAKLVPRPGEANVAAAQVTLPRSLFLDQDNLSDVCTNVQFNAGAGNGEGCPPSSVYGVARATTPLLDRPLEGPVLLRSSANELPDLVAVLRGQVTVVLVGRVDSVRGRIRTTFEAVPDAPVESFALKMRGRGGLLVNSTGLCGRVNRARMRLFGHNGKVLSRRPAVRTSCRKKRRRAARRHTRGSGKRPAGR